MSITHLNVHLHCLVLDGVYGASGHDVVFHDPRAPSGDELERLLEWMITRLMKMLIRKGYLIEEQEVTYLAEIDADNPVASLQAASWPCRPHRASGPVARRA